MKGLRKERSSTGLRALGLSLTLLINPALAQTPTNTCPDMTAAANAVKEKYQASFTKLQQDGDDLNNDFKKPSPVGAGVGVDFKVDMKDQKWIFDLPSVNIKNTDMYFGTPSVTVKNQKIIFDTPSVRMKNQKCGQYPEFHGLSVHWSDIICSVPETFMERHEILMGIPEFFMQQQHIIMGIPEVTMVKQEWHVKIPEFTLINVHAEIGNMKDKANTLKTQGDNLSGNMKKELVTVIQSGFACYRTNLENAKASLAPQMDAAIAQMNSAVTQVRGAGGNPEAVGSPPVNMVQQVANLVSQKTQSLTSIDSQIANLLDQEKLAIDKLSAPPTP
jgi:hypothetical protein